MRTVRISYVFESVGVASRLNSGVYSWQSYRIHTTTKLAGGKRLAYVTMTGTTRLWVWGNDKSILTGGVGGVLSFAPCCFYAWSLHRIPVAIGAVIQTVKRWSARVTRNHYYMFLLSLRPIVYRAKPPNPKLLPVFLSLRNNNIKHHDSKHSSSRNLIASRSCTQTNALQSSPLFTSI